VEDDYLSNTGDFVNGELHIDFEDY